MAKTVTVTNPVTGQPAQVDQLDHTAQQIDDAILKTKYLTGRNLLDNAYWASPDAIIDQRQGRVVKPNTTYYSDNQLTTAAGITSAYVTAYRYATGTVSGVNYASFKLEDKDTAPTYYAAPENVVRGYAGVGYTIDRWRSDRAGNAVIVEQDCLHLTTTQGGAGALIQEFEKGALKSGNTYTYSAIIGGELLTTTFVLSESLVAHPIGNGLHATTVFSGGVWMLYAFVNYTSAIDVKIKAAKLELGTQQTLAHQENGNWVLNDPPPDKGMALLKCQRYQIIYGAYIYIRASCVTTNYLEFVVWLPTAMRTTPSCDWTGVAVKSLGGGNQSGFTFTIDRMKQNALYIRATKSSHGLTDGILSLAGALFNANL